ncbi:type II toxin-antitoxin system HicA family toxin [Akkermansiaceae bacterium]|nr:type II toxin-antitoxin system HicA family toxin [Akkermansiaceae bacterium]MDA7888409.1 type II toxin-antitoxin system HicA family toxin [Akkermansiaceae bacterium]
MARRLSSSAFISILTSNGFTFISKRGSHAKYRDDNSHTVIVPLPRKDIPIGTLRSMIRQSCLPKELFD